jgi:single-strand DNA-binding protein
MNNITISGRLTKEVELKKTNNNKQYVMNTLAVYRDKENTDFIKFMVWEHQAEYLSRNAKKGDMAVISGSLQVSQYESNGQKKEDYRVVAKDIVLMPTNKKEEPKQEEVVDNSSIELNISPDDLPFD